jgi:hypothetical protein
MGKGRRAVFVRIKIKNFQTPVRRPIAQNFHKNILCSIFISHCIFISYVTKLLRAQSSLSTTHIRAVAQVTISRC